MIKCENCTNWFMRKTEYDVYFKCLVLDEDLKIERTQSWKSPWWDSCTHFKRKRVSQEGDDDIRKYYSAKGSILEDK